jgi:hypothetical protein
MDLFRTAGEDDSYAVADVFPIFAHSNLADSEPYLTSTRVGSFKKKNHVQAFNIKNRILWSCWELAGRVAQISDGHACHVVC